MMICGARLLNTSNALVLRMSSEQIRLHVSPKLFEVNRWIPQLDWLLVRRQKMHGPKGATANLQNWQFMTSGRLQMLVTSNFRDWHTVISR